MKEGSLFCFEVMRSTELGCFKSCYWCLWKALNKKKNYGYKNQIWEPSVKNTRQMRARVDTTQRKNENKQSIKNKK